MKFINKNILLLVIGIMIFILGQVGVNYIIYKSKTSNEIPVVQLKNKEKRLDTFAIMLEQTDGTYKATSSSSFNQSGYFFNSTKSSCIDVDGNKVDGILTYDGGDKTVEVTSNKTVYCYVYFDKKATAVDQIITLASQDEIVYDGTADNNLRYIGANPNNYIYFNCSDYNNPTASTCEKWRIIGAFNNVENAVHAKKTLFKIIRSESLGNYYWDYKQSGVGSADYGYGSNDWSDSQLMLMLNGVSLNNYKSGYTVSGNYLLDKNNIRIMNISGSYYAGSSVTYIPAQTTTSGYSNTATANFSSKGLKNDTTREMIAFAIWKLGGTTGGITGDFYSYERGTQVYTGHSTEWAGKIGLMYPSDYGYATGGGSTTNRETCLATRLYDWDHDHVSDCRNNDWLFMDGYGQWTLSPIDVNSYRVFYIADSGYMSPEDDANYFQYIVRPTVYLTSNIVINGGAGTSANPYTIKAS